MEVNFTKEHLIDNINNDGHYDLATPKGKIVLTIMHPVQINEQPIPQHEIDEARANVRLHQMASSMFDVLEVVSERLIDLRDGKVTIFAFDINYLISSTKTVLKRATEKD